MDLAEQVIVRGSLETAEEVEALFRRMHAEGQVTQLCGELDYQGEPRGAPELRRAADGFLYPLKAHVDYEREGHQFRFDFDHIMRATTIRVQGPVGCLEVMEGFLASEEQGRAKVSARDLSSASLARIYELIKAEAGGLQVHRDCRIRLDDEGRFVPESVSLDCELDGRKLEVELGSGQFALYCETSQAPQAAGTLQRLVQFVRAEEKAAQARQGHVQSLNWEIDVRGYTWDRVGGLDDVTEQLREWVELPLRNPLAFERLGLRPPRGVLLCGPPGTGKTTLAKILACESRSAFFSVSPGDISSMWYGQTERNIQRIFAAARAHPRAILFIDEIDGFLATREGATHEATRRALAQIMTEMDGLVDSRSVMVLGATNRPGDLDPALRRPGRFDHHVTVGLPNEAGRKAILRVHLQAKPVEGLDLDVLAARSEGQSGAQLELWCSRATFQAWKREARSLGKAPADLEEEEIAAVRVRMEDFE